jgi:hypothetical protein
LRRLPGRIRARRLGRLLESRPARRTSRSLPAGAAPLGSSSPRLLICRGMPGFSAGPNASLSSPIFPLFHCPGP